MRIMMYPTSISRKRSRDELDVGDECLPISKRINSLRIENQVPGLCPQGPLVSPFAGCCDNVASSSSPLTIDTGNHQHDVPPAMQSGIVRRLDLNSDVCNSQRLPTIEEHDGSMNVSNGYIQSFRESHSHFRRSLSDPYPTFSEPSSLGHSFSSHSQQPEISHTSLRPEIDCPEYRMHMVNPSPSSSHFFNHNQISGSFHSLNVPHSDQLQNGLFLPSNNPESLPHNQDHMAVFHPALTNNPHEQNLPSPQHAFHYQQIPAGPYEPELGVTENPHYYSINQLLYEAHLSRLRRDNVYSLSGFK